jgi:hypothetical protein
VGQRYAARRGPSYSIIGAWVNGAVRSDRRVDPQRSALQAGAVSLAASKFYIMEYAASACRRAIKRSPLCQLLPGVLRRGCARKALPRGARRNGRARTTGSGMLWQCQRGQPLTGSGAPRR